MVAFKLTYASETKTYIVHKEFACYYSPLLDAAFNGTLDIAKTQTFTIGDGTTFDAFHLLLQWLYRQAIHLTSLAKDLEKQSPSKRAEFCAAIAADEARVIELWILASKLHMPRLQNLAMDKLVELYEAFPYTAPSVDYVYANTAAGSVLRRFFVKKLAYSNDDSIFMLCPEVLPHEFLIDLTLFTRKVGREGEPIHAEDYYVAVEEQ